MTIFILEIYDILDKRIYSEHSDTEMDIWIKILVPHQTGTVSFAVIWKERENREVFSSDWNWVDLLSLCRENAIFELQLKTFSFSKVDFVSLETKLTL